MWLYFNVASPNKRSFGNAANDRRITFYIFSDGQQFRCENISFFSLVWLIWLKLIWLCVCVHSEENNRKLLISSTAPLPTTETTTAQISKHVRVHGHACLDGQRPHSTEFNVHAPKPCAVRPYRWCCNAATTRTLHTDENLSGSIQQAFECVGLLFACRWSQLQSSQEPSGLFCFFYVL